MGDLLPGRWVRDQDGGGCGGGHEAATSLGTLSDSSTNSKKSNHNNSNSNNGNSNNNSNQNTNTNNVGLRISGLGFGLSGLELSLASLGSKPESPQQEPVIERFRVLRFRGVDLKA